MEIPFLLPLKFMTFFPPTPIHSTLLSRMMDISCVLVLLTIPWTSAQYTNVVLSQGTLVGLKVFPESSRVPVYAFLGIPYAKPPIDELRFAPPVPHPGWNGTLIARDFQPICPQPDVSPLEESSDYNPLASPTSENCLFLNVWTPETGFRYGNIPVVLIITGEDHAFDYLRHRPTGKCDSYLLVFKNR